MVLAGCGKDKNDSIPGGTDTPSQPSGSGDGGSGSGGSGDGGTGGEGGQQQPGGGGEQGGGQQGGGGQGGEGGGGQGGEGGGGGEQQQGSRFVGKKLTIADAKDQYGQPLDNAVRDSILNSYGDGWVSLFDNFKFELVNPLPTTSYDVVKGNFEVANNDTSCVLTTSKIFSGEHQVYSYEIPTEMASFTITYSLNTQQYSVSMSEETGPDEYFFFTLILQAADASPEPVNIPEDPNGEDFDPHYQVTKTRWDQLFNSEGGIVQENFTVSHPIKFGEQVVDTDTWEVNNNKIHYFSASQPLLDFYYQIKSPIIEEGAVQAFNTYTCYQYAADDWRLNSNGGLDLGNLIHGSGLLQFDISKFNFSNFESTHYYYRSSLNLTCDYDDAGHNLTDIKVWFNNGNLQKIEYTEFGEKAEFTFTKCGSTTFTFPIDVPQGGGMTTSYSQARTAFANATGITLPEREGLEVETSPFTPGVSTSFCFDINSGATQADLTAFKDFFDNLQGWSLENTNVAGGYTTYSYENTDEDTIQLVWDENNNGIYINYIWNDNGGDPQPAEWPTATVNSYLAAIGVTTDSLPAAQDGNVTEYTFAPADLASVTDNFVITCVGGSGLASSYASSLTGFTYDSGESFYVSPNEEFAVNFWALGENFIIDVGAYDNGGSQPTHVAPFMQYKTTGDWQYAALAEDPEDATQYKVAEVSLVEGEEFTFCIDNSDPDPNNHDWRHYSDVSSTYSFAYDDFESSSDEYHNIKVKAGRGGVYDIYIKKNVPNPWQETVFINKHIDARYMAAKSAFEAAAPGITIPILYGIGADFYDDPVRFYTDTNATAEDFAIFVAYFNIILSTWEHEGPLDGDHFVRHTYTNNNDDEVEIEFYDYGENDRYLVVSYTPNETPSAVWPIDWVNNLLTVWEVEHDTIPQIDGLGVTSFDVDPSEVESSSTYAMLTATGGASKEDSFITALDTAGYEVNTQGYYETNDGELLIMLDTVGNDLLIIIMRGHGPIIMYSDGSEFFNVDLKYDGSQYYIEDIFLYEDYEFVLYLDNTTMKTFEDFVVSNPDTSEGHIEAGEDCGPAKHTFKVNADGSYDIYINSLGEVYIVYDMIPVLQYGSDLNGWDVEEFEQLNGQLEIHDLYLEAGTELVVHLSKAGEYGVWLHYSDFVPTEYSEGKIGQEGENLKILVDGTYNFYVTGGKIYVTTSE